MIEWGGFRVTSRRLDGSSENNRSGKVHVTESGTAQNEMEMDFLDFDQIKAALTWKKLY
jgi:hypothetical protein